MRCAKCGGTEFYNPRQPSSCKGCAKARAIRRYATKRDEILAYQHAKYQPRTESWRPKLCERCQGEYKPNSGSQRFCDECRPLVKREARRRWRRMNPAKVKAWKARWYASHRETILAKPRTIEQRKAAVERASRWARANPERARQHARTKQLNRRARKHAGFIEPVDPQRVYEIHGGRCGICGLFIDGDFHVDHVTPLSRGGQHGYINVQPAHPHCNSSKGAKVAA